MQQSAVGVLPSRLTPQVPRVGVVSRPALVDRIRRTSEAPLVTVTAPAGYGKTTLLAQWADRDPRPFAWMSLDHTFDDPAVLMTYLAFALKDVVPVSDEAFDDLAAPHPAQRSRILAGLASAVAASTQPFVLVLDDIHHLANTQGIEAVQTIVGHLPKGSHVAIAGRATASIGLARMRSEGLVLDVGMQDLRFDAPEARQLFAANNVDMSEDALADLVTRTDGWPVALYFAALASDAGALPETTPHSFTGDDRFLADYIRSEFLDQLTPDRRQFLIRTSVLDELAGPLCDAALERSGSATLLEEFEASNLLLVPLDRQRRWYRYHHVFRDLLRHELDRLEPGAATAIAVRASEWCAENDLLDGAIRYAQLAGDVTRVGRIVLNHGMRQYAMGRGASVRNWFAWLGDHGAVDGGVAVLGGWLNLLSGDSAEANRWASVAEQAPQDAGQDETLPDGSTLSAWVSTLRAAMATDLDQMRSEAERSLRLLAPSSQFRPTVAFLLGSAELCQGSLDVADVQLEDAVQLGVSLGGTAAATSALAARAIIATRRDRWLDARALIERSASLVRSKHLESYSSTALTHAVRSRVAVHDGEPRAAREDAKAAERLLPLLTRALRHAAILTRLELVRAYVALGDARSARTGLQAIHDLLVIGHGLGALREETEHLSALVDEMRTQVPDGQALTPAELRLLPYLATQLSFREIAEQLFVSFHTVRAQVTSIYRKLSVSSRTQAIERSRSIGLLPSDDTT